METAKIVEGQNVIEEQTSDIMVYADSLEISSQEGVEKGTEYIKNIKALRVEVNGTFDPVVTSAHKAHKEAVAAKKKHLEPLDKAERMIKGKIGDHLDRIEEEQRKEEALKVKEARKERDRLVAAANRRMDKLMENASDTQGKIDALQKDLDDNPTLSDDEEAIISAKIDTLKVILENHTEAAEVKRAEVEVAQTAPVVVAPPKVATKVKGMSSTVKKKGEVTDSMKLIKAVASGQIPEGVITFDMTAINKLLNAGMTIPGVYSKEERSVSIR